jgi:hypothetical protein
MGRGPLSGRMGVHIFPFGGMAHMVCYVRGWFEEAPAVKECRRTLRKQILFPVGLD